MPNPRRPTKPSHVGTLSAMAERQTAEKAGGRGGTPLRSCRPRPRDGSGERRAHAWGTGSHQWRTMVKFDKARKTPVASSTGVGATELAPALSDAQVQQFIQDGYVRIDGAFARQLAEEGRTILWHDLPCDPHDRTTWTQPVVRLGWYAQEPFRKAANTPVLHAAFDQLVGKRRWRPRTNVGSFPVRFPSREDPGDAGWHVDVSFPPHARVPGGNDDFSSWRANVASRDRALLMLFLFSDVGCQDAPTRLLVGSHREIARLLQPAADAGLSHGELSMGAAKLAAAGLPQALARGEAGTVYLCHPFLVHAAQRHRGSTARFLAQPPLHPAEPFQLDRADGDFSPVEIAIRQALQSGGSR